MVKNSVHQNQINQNIVQKNAIIYQCNQIMDKIKVEEVQKIDNGKNISLKDAIINTKDELFLQSSTLNLETLHDEKVVLVEGWCPETQKIELHNFTKKDNIVCTQHKATIDEKPPVLLKNNKFTKLFEPTGNLFPLPAYSEIDLTIFFAPFFVLFFGFCLGDTGYGVVYLILGTLLKLKINKLLFFTSKPK